MSSLPCRPRTSLIPLAWVLSPSWQPAFERFCNKIRGKKSAVLVSAPWDFNVILLTVLRWWHLAFKIQLTALTFGLGGTCFIRLRVYLCLEIERVEMQTKVMIGTAGLVCMNVRAARVWRGIYKNSKSFLSDVECYTRGQCSAPVFGLEFIYSGRRGDAVQWVMMEKKQQQEKNNNNTKNIKWSLWMLLLLSVCQRRPSAFHMRWHPLIQAVTSAVITREILSEGIH